MSRKGKRTSSVRRSAEGAGAVAPPLPAALVALAALTAVAPLVATQITPSEVDNTLSGGATGLVLFGALVLGVLALALLSAARRGEILIPRSWLLAAAGLMAAGTVVSSLTAADRYRALLGAVQVLVGLAYFVTALMVTDGRNRMRWLLAALVAGAVASAGTSFVMRLMTPPETLLEYFEENREQILRERGIEPESAEEEMYRRRIATDYVSTFFHPNLLAAYMAVGVLLAAGLVIGHVRGASARTAPFALEEPTAAAVARERLAPAVQQRPYTMMGSVLIAVCGAAMAGALVMTRGRAAMAATVCGLYLMLVLGLVKTRAAKVRWLAVAAVAGAALGAAVVHEDWLPSVTSRLRFQLDYMRGTWGVISDHPWLGVGPDNFGSYYLEHKSAAAPEQIDHPHNWLLWAWSSIGVAGLVGLAGLVALGFREALRHMRPVIEPPLKDEQIVRPLLGLIVAAGVLIAFYEVRGSPGGDAGAMQEVIMSLLSKLALLFAPLLAAIILGHETDQSLWNISRKWGRYALAAAMAAFWLEGMMSLSAPHLPTMMAAYAMIALLAATTQDRAWFRVAMNRRRRMVLGAAVVLGAAGYVFLVAMPVVGGASAVGAAREYPQTSEKHRERVREAAARCPWWSTPYEMLADSDWLLAKDARKREAECLRQAEAAGLETAAGQQLVRAAQQEGASAKARLEDVVAELDEAMVRGPHDANLSHKSAMVLVELADLYGGETDRERALGEMHRAVSLNPTEARWRVEYMDLLKRWDRESEAAQQAREAIRLDDAMSDELLKLGSAERARCEQMARKTAE